MHMRSQLDVKLALQGREFVFSASGERDVYLTGKAEIHGGKSWRRGRKGIKQAPDAGNKVRNQAGSTFQIFHITAYIRISTPN
jgi:hypothetical protein